MKKISIVFAAVLLVAILASCSLTKEAKTQSDNDANSKKLVRVYFDSVTTKSLSTNHGDFQVAYYLDATPKFKRTDGRAVITGKVENQYLGLASQESFDAGYFEQGEWDFILSAVLQKSNGEGVPPTKSAVIATAPLKTVYISPANNRVSFTLTDTTFGDQDKGTIDISVKVPQVAEKVGDDYGVTMKVFLDNAATAETTTFTFAEAQDESANLTDLLLATGSLANIKAGNHVVKLVYYVNKTEGQTTTLEKVCSQSIEVYVVPNAPAQITGTMLNGEFVEGTIQVTYETNKWNLSLAASKSVVEANEETTITCTVTGATTSVSTYTWYVNGEITTNSNTDKSVFKFTPTKQGIYNIACSAKVGTIEKSASVYVYADNAAAPKN